MQRVTRFTLVGLLTVAVLSAGAQTPAGVLAKASPVRTDSAGGEVVRNARPQVVIAFMDSIKGEWIPDVEVIDSVSGDRARSSKDGYVSLSFVTIVSDSMGVVDIRKVGYMPLHVTFSMKRPALGQILMVPQPEAATLPVVDVVAKNYASRVLRGFEERRSSGQYAPSHFITPDQMRTKWAGQTMRAVLADFEARARMSGHGPTSLKNTYCRVARFRDGLPLNIDINSEAAEAYEAAEFYPLSQLPAGIVGVLPQNACGAIILYTRNM